MEDIQNIRMQLRSIEWVSNPFPLLSTITRICIKDINIGREFVIRALEHRDDLSHEYKEILDELTIQVGLFPYVSNLTELSLRSAFLHAAHRADGQMDKFVLHKAQARVLNRLLDGESIILSAPTSFGKSLLIDVVIAAKDFKNIVLIVPTLALAEETRRRMSRFIDRYSIITSNNQKTTKRNIFVLTQERFNSMESEIPEIDFFVIDEFYKLSISNEGNRATQLNHALIRLTKTRAQFYLLGPSIREIPPQVMEKLNCSFLIEDFQTVAIELHRITKKPNKEEAFAQLLDSVEGQTMVYCQSPSSTRRLIRKYLQLRKIKVTVDEELIEAAKWTSKYYHNEWLVSIALKHGIGIHHGKLPRSLGRFMIRAFEEGKLRVLLCTSTLIEGVNTTARNVILYDSKLNNKPLDFFTFNNIKGRTGRMFRHFVGHVYVFDAPPEEKFPFVDIPAVNPTETTPSSILLQLPASSIPTQLRKRVNSILEQNYLPLDLLKNNSNIEPEFLLATAIFLYNLSTPVLMQLSWSTKPRYEDIEFTSDIIWNQLGGANSARQGSMRSAKMMTMWIWRLYKTRSLSLFRKSMIQDQISRDVSPDDAVENVLSFLRGWASFNYPKYLSILNDVVNYVMSKRGFHGCNYIPFAASIEHLFQPNSFSSLEEYGLPTELSEKLLAHNIIKKDDNLDDIINTLRSHELQRYAEGIYEKRIIEDFQSGIGRKNSFDNS